MSYNILDSYCTPKKIAERIGYVDVDPCSNDRSHILAGRTFCGINGLLDDGLMMSHTVRDDEDVFINPPYSRGQVLRWVLAYLRTRFIFLVRHDPSTQWWDHLIGVRPRPWLWFPRLWRIEFEPPPGVVAEGVRFPHVIVMRDLPSGLREWDEGATFRRMS